ncbi:MAG: hypothetical protein H6636_07175 [Anaerolineales bacterium]|nr:hypothetical protein [Anaerolineales bacterium]
MIRRFVFLCLLALLFSLKGETKTLAIPSTPEISQPVVSYVPTTLDVCLPYEPDTLYMYGGSTLTMHIIQEAIYDGPIDTAAYGFQPIILEQIPTVENGGVLIQPVTVHEGDTIVNIAEDVVPLTSGELIFPSGCYSDACAIPYNGGEVLMDQVSATFDLLPGLTWSDGTPLTAADSVYSYQLRADPATPMSKYVEDRTASYQANSDTQTVWAGYPGYHPALQWNQYYTFFWQPLPEHLWGSYTAEELLTIPISTRMPLGWGAYVIDEWVTGSHVSLHKNPYYFRAEEGLPAFENLIFHFSAHPLADILNGTCDLVAIDAQLDDYLPYDAAGILDLVISPSAIWEHLDFGMLPVETYTGFAGQTLAFQDPNIRKAFAYCLDREALQEDVYAGYGEIFHAYISPNHPYYPADATEYPFDPAQGRALLEAAGWVDTNGNGIREKEGVEFSVNMVTTDAPHRLIMVAAMAAQMNTNCGIQIIPEHLSTNETFASWPDGPIFGRQFDLAEYAWLSNGTPTCDLFITEEIPGNLSPGGSNNTGYSNPSYDTACQTALDALSETDKQTYHEAAVRIFTQDLPVLPLFSRLNVGASIPYLTGFTLDPTETPLWNLEEIHYFVETAEIPPEGGSFTSSLDQTTFTFPAGTFTETVTLTYVPLFDAQAPDSSELVPIRHTFGVSAVYTANGQPAHPTDSPVFMVSYTDAELGVVMENTLAIYRWDGTQWEREPWSTLDVENNGLVTAFEQFSLWAVMGETNHLFLPVVHHE